MPAKTAKPKPEKTDTIKKEKQQKTDSTEHKKTIMPVMDKKEEIHGRVLYVEPDNTDFVEEKWPFFGRCTEGGTTVYTPSGKAL